MQFERPTQIRISTCMIPQDSFLPIARRGSVLDASSCLSTPPHHGGVKKVDEKQDLKPLRKDIRNSAPRKQVRFELPPRRQVWEFGKRKTFVRPTSSKKNNAAAITIQRIARGGWQRLKFRIVLLQYKLDTRQERTAAAIANVHDQMQARREKYLTKMTAQHNAEMAKGSLEKDLSEQLKQVIDFLRKDNKKIRRRNEKLYEEMSEFSNQNKRLEEVNQQIAADFAELQTHVKEVMETNAKLLEVVKDFKKNIKSLQRGCDLRNQHGLAEQRVKISYMKCVGKTVELVENRCKDSALADEVIGYCLDTTVTKGDGDLL